MPDTLLSIVIEPGFLAGVVTLNNQGATEVIQSVWVRRTDSLSTDIENLLEQIKQPSGQTILSIGSDKLGFYSLHFPFHNKKKIAEVLPFELEAATSHNLNEHFFAYHILREENSGSKVLVGLIEKKEVEQPLAILRESGIEPTQISLAGLSQTALHNADSNENSCHLYFAANKVLISLSKDSQPQIIRQVHLIRKDSFSSATKLGKIIRQTFLSLSTPFTQCAITISGEIEKEFADALSSSLSHPVTYSWTGELPLIKVLPEIHQNIEEKFTNEAIGQAAIFNKKILPYFNFKKASPTLTNDFYLLKKVGYGAAIVMLALICFGGWAWLDYNRLKTQNEALTTEINTIFRKTLPEVTRIVNPVQQLQTHLAQLKKSHTVQPNQTHFTMLELLAQLSLTIPIQENITLSKMIAEQNNVQLKGTAKDFTGVDRIQKRLQNSAAFSDVKINSANLNSQKDKVLFELKMTSTQNHE